MYNKRDKCVTCWILILGKEIQPRDPLGLIEMHYSAVHYLSLSPFFTFSFKDFSRSQHILLSSKTL